MTGALPEGFVLEEGPPAAATLPDGFVLEKSSLRGAYKRAIGDSAELERGLTVPGVVRGLTDLRDAGSQLIGRGLTAIAPAGSSFEQWVKDQTKIVEDRNKAGEAEYQKGRADRGDSGIDTGRLAGNVLATAPFGGPSAQTLLGKTLSNAATGAVVAPLSQPVYEGDYWPEKGKQATAGAVGGAVATPVMAAAGRVVAPNAVRDPNVQTLVKEGVRLTPGQMAGGVVKRTEDAATSIPLLGDMIRNQQRQGITDLNRVVLDRALEPIGAKVPKDINVGREGVAYVQKTLGDAYDDVLSRVTVPLDRQFIQDSVAIHNATQAMEPNLAKQFSGIFQTKVVDKFANGQQIDGRAMKMMESELGQLAKGYSTSPMMSERQLGESLKDLQGSLRDLVARTNPAEAPKLQALNKAWGNLAIAENAAAGNGAKGGIFSPNQLSAAVKKGDTSVRDRKFAAGDARMQDLSDPASQVMPSSVPDSGTALRMLTGAGALGGAGYGAKLAALDPLTLLAGGGALGGALGAYTGPGRAIAEFLMARGADWRQPLARGLLDTTPALGAAAGTALAPRFGLLN
jgi:hypothetical protein